MTTPRWPYLVACPAQTQARLVVISDSPEGAASFMALHVSEIEGEASGPYTFSVRPMSGDLSDGVLLWGHDESDDLEALLRTEPAPCRPGQVPLWGPAVEVTLE